MDVKEINILLLVGGKSSRMGYSKAHIKYGAKEIYKQLLIRFDAIGMKSFLSINAHQVNSFDASRLIVDDLSSIGPMGALKTYFNHFSNPVLLLACDMPNISIDTLFFLINEYSEKKDVTLFKSDDKMQPLFAIYNKSCLAQLDYAIESQNYKMYAFLEKCNKHIVSLEGEDHFANINTSEELKSYLNDI